MDVATQHCVKVGRDVYTPDHVGTPTEGIVGRTDLGTLYSLMNAQKPNVGAVRPVPRFLNPCTKDITDVPRKRKSGQAYLDAPYGNQKRAR